LKNNYELFWSSDIWEENQYHLDGHEQNVWMNAVMFSIPTIHWMIQTSAQQAIGGF
jgi:hypothetical protein